MATSVTVDVAGGPMGGAARFRTELYQYLARTGRKDVKVIGAQRRIDPAWLIRREMAGPTRVRRVALNNVGFVAPGGERWTLLGNALHFLTDAEIADLPSSLSIVTKRQASIVRLAARRSDVLVAPCSAMAERVCTILPSVRNHIFARMHPVSADSIPDLKREPIILCPAFFTPYRHMEKRLRELLVAIADHIDLQVRLVVTAEPEEVPPDVVNNKRVEVVGRLPISSLQHLWARSSAIYYPPGLESFGYPLAEARVSGRPVIACDTAQNREIAGLALCGFDLGDEESLRRATILALSADILPDPAPFDPEAYFDWMLGPPR